MDTAVLGTGAFGSHLGLGLRLAGHTVVYGARNLRSDSVRALRAREPHVEIVPLREAALRADVVIVATAPDSLADIAAAVGGACAGKVVIDTTNALDWSHRPPRMVSERSQAEVLADLLPEARVVKAFNTLRAEHTSASSFAQGRAITFVCADDDEGRATVMSLADDLGFEALDAGPLDSAYAAEQAAALWIGIARRDGFGRNAALSLTRRGPVS